MTVIFISTTHEDSFLSI